MSVPEGSRETPADNMASAKALRLHRGDSCAWTNECRSNVGASEGDKSGEGLSGEGGIYPEGYGSHKVLLVLPKLLCGCCVAGVWFSAIRKEVQP